MKWTKEHPTTTGYYWYKFDVNSTPIIVEYDDQMKWAHTIGYDAPYSNEPGFNSLDGFFYLEQIQCENPF